MKILSQIQHCIKSGRYEITIHADEESQEDDVSISDIKHAVLTGRLITKYTDDPRGTRYKILGKTLDERELFVICRFNDLQEVRIITVFTKE